MNAQFIVIGGIGNDIVVIITVKVSTVNICCIHAGRIPSTEMKTCLGIITRCRKSRPIALRAGV